MRRYRIADGHLEDFVAAWASGVVPLREASGFVIEGSWSIPATNEFVWILSYSGEGGFEEADAAYYASAERIDLTPNPARWIVAAFEDWAVPTI